MYIAASNKKHNWENYTLFVPTVSVGNVGQLAADLIISTLWMDRVGYVHHPALTPVVGNNPFAHEDATSCKITTGCEVYESVNDEVVVIQQRAPFIKGRRKEFAKWLVKWIRSHHFYRVVILTTSFAQERLDHQISGSPFRILMSPSMSKENEEFFNSEMDWKVLEPRASMESSLTSPAQTESGSTDPSTIFMPGSGIAKNLFEGCQNEKALVFMMFCSEGDNAADALGMAGQLNSWLSLLGSRRKASLVEGAHVAKGISTWRVPMSWRLVYGSGFDQKLFQ